MNKYIVKNCPAYNEDTLECCGKDTSYINCFNNTSERCPIKQMLDKCKKETDPTQYEWKRERENIAKEILDMFEVVKVEE